MVYAFSQNPEKASPFQARDLNIITILNTQIRHITGKANRVTDTLSRLEVIELLANIDYEQIAQTQISAPELLQLVNTPSFKIR